MLPTFVIGLREGLEAALIVGIIAAFLRKQGRRDLLRWVMSGVVLAIVLCVGAGVALDLYSHSLPQRQQEGLETVIGLFAVAMVTYMVIWMRRNSRHLKGQLEGLAADAMANGRAGSSAARAMVLMAFLAVIREGLETVVFLLAAFNESTSSRAAGVGVVLGILVAIGLGYGIYRGGVRINLSRFFRGTGIVLVLVAAGIFVNALNTAHEAGWLNVGQRSTVDLTWLVAPGTVQASLLTGMLGIQQHPVVIEILGWLAYLIPVGLYVAWPPGRPAPARAAARAGAIVAAVAAGAALVLVLVAPGSPAQRPTTTGGGISAQVTERSGGAALVRTQTAQPVAGGLGPTDTVHVRAAGFGTRDGTDAERFRTTLPADAAATAGRPATLSVARVGALNGGRLPLSTVRDAAGRVPVSYRATRTLTVWLDTRTDRVLALSWQEQVQGEVHTASADEPLTRPIASATRALPTGAAASAAHAASDAHATLDRRAALHTLAEWCLALVVIALLASLGFGLAARSARRRSAATQRTAEPAADLVRS